MCGWFSEALYIPSIWRTGNPVFTTKVQGNLDIVFAHNDWIIIVKNGLEVGEHISSRFFGQDVNIHESCGTDPKNREMSFVGSSRHHFPSTRGCFGYPIIYRCWQNCLECMRRFSMRFKDPRAEK